MKHIFIINPAAGKADSTNRIRAMAEKLALEHDLDCRCILTEGPKDATRIAREAAETGEEVRLYACGGDGTAAEVAAGAAGYPNVAMTCIPVGTGNDMLRNFGEDAEKFADAENLWNGPDFPLDLIECNGHLCLTVACNGLDAQIGTDVHLFDGVPFLTGHGKYLASVVRNFFFRALGHRWTVTVDGETFTDDFALIAVCNGRYYGGGCVPAPAARLDDGELQAVMIRKVDRPTFLRLFPSYSKGQHDKIPEAMMRSMPAKEVIISADEPFTTALDGEGHTWNEAVIRLSDKPLRFFAPASASPNATAQTVRLG